jgi:aldose 1-epimerase
MTVEVVRITDESSGSIAQIAPGLGFNCFSFQAPLGDQLVETLWAHPEFISGSQRPSGSGIPILFPFAGRIPGTSFEYQGTTYELTPGDAMGNAIHGFVMGRPWRVIAQTPSSVTGEFQGSVDEPTLSRSWPCDFRIRATYEVRGASLLSTFVVDNPDTKPLPFTLATHAYFRLPVGGSGTVADTLVTVPVRAAWQLENLIPTGEKIGIPGLEGLLTGLPLADRVFDNVLTDIVYDGTQAHTKVQAPSTGHTLTQSFDNSFRHVVVYTPPHREAICMEPYSAIPNALALSERGIETGLRWLQPGESYETQIVIGLS